jgi:hypothetical protein
VICVSIQTKIIISKTNNNSSQGNHTVARGVASCIAKKQEIQQYAKFQCIEHLLLVVYLGSWFNSPYSSSFLFITT